MSLQRGPRCQFLRITVNNPRKSAGFNGTIRMTDVARVAGVSLVTVSRAINQPDKLAPDTLTVVQQAITQLGYVPNLMAGSLASSRSRIIAAMVPTISNLVFAETIEALTERLNASGYQLLLAQTHYRQESEPHLLDTFLGRRVDGVVLLGDVQHAHSPQGLGPSIEQRLRESGIPVVQTWDLLPNPIDMQVGFSNFAVGQAAGNYLCQQGHRNIGFIGADEPRSNARLQGLRSAVQAQGGTVFAAPTAPPAGIEAAAPQLTQLLQQKTHFSAVFCNSDLLAAGVLFECRERGLNVPEQLAVMGLGDMPIAAAASPKITTIRLHRRHIGEITAKLLIDSLQNKSARETSIDIGFDIIQRASA